MDLNSLTSDKKHQKRCKTEENHKRSISICDLPDHILQYIISFIPTKDAFRTSLVSRRWGHLWKGISKIELELEVGPTTEKRQQFMHFLKTLFVACDWADLKRLYLSFIIAHDGSLVSEWLRRFINPKIQELRLELRGVGTRPSLILPDHLFTCAALTEFHLKMNHYFILPRSIHFASLRTLTLEFVIFPHNSTEQFFNGCPSLEELKLICCQWSNVKSPVTISFPLLQQIHIKDWKDYYADESYRCQVVIIATNLKAFSYEGPHQNDFSLHRSSSSVIKASIKNFGDLYKNPRYTVPAGNFVFKLLRGLSSVETLSLSHNSLMEINREVLPGDLPLFSNLAELSLLPKGPNPLSCEVLLAILRNSPRLRVLNFKEGVSWHSQNFKLDPLPICFRTHLKIIRINYFGDVIDGWRNPIKVLLQSASVLDKLYIRWDVSGFKPPLRLEALKNVREEIESFPRGSMDCEIVAEYF